MNTVVLGLGSNRAYDGMDCLTVLREACKSLKKLLPDLHCSSVYSTMPMYVKEQNRFYNMCVCASYEGSAFELLDEIHVVEADFGRNRDNEIRNGPRSLDIDIELFGKETIKTKNLIIPHPRIQERAFVLVPMMEILEKNTFYAESIDMEKYRLMLKNMNLCEDLIQLCVKAEDFYV